MASKQVLIVHADTLTGEVRGSVLDVQGKLPLTGVTMTLINIDRGWKKQMQTDAAGNYVFLQLEPGSYTVAAEMSGYFRMERTDVLIRLNQPKVVIPPFELRKLVTTPTEQITVRGEQTKTAIIDLTVSGPTRVVLAYVNEPGLTSLVSLLDAALRFNFDVSLVHHLPLKGTRTFDQLALLAPGVFRVPFSAGQGPAVGIGVGTTGQFSVNGMRGRSNNFTVDGSDNNDEDIGVRRQGFVALIPQTIESVQEFQIITAGFPAEFGRNSGSMVNAVSRSGQKELHGTIYGLFNDDALNAGNFFEQKFADAVNVGNLNGGRFKGKDFTQAVFGGVVGGRIIPEKLFYFISAERQQSHGTSLGHFVVPTTGERGLRIKRDPDGDIYQQNGFVPVDQLLKFFQPPDGRFISYSDLAGKGVFSLYPLANNPAGPFGAHNYSQAKRNEASGLVFSIKNDWYITSAHSFAARYNFTNDNSILPFTSDAINSSLATGTRTQNISLFLNSTTPHYGNALRLSYGRTRLEFPPEKSSPFLFGSAITEEFSRLVNRPIQAIETPYGRFGPFGATGPIGQLSIIPYSTIGIDVFNFPQGRVDNTFQISDFVARSGAAHTIKTGFDIRRSQLNSFSDRNSRPLLLFGNGVVSDACALNPFCVFAAGDDRILRGTDLAALGAAAGFLQSISTGALPDTTIGLRFTQYDLFIQDDWKLRKNLTLNLGLRYDLQTVPSEVNRRIERTFGLTPDQFPRLQPAGSAEDQGIITRGNQGFDAALGALQRFIAGRKRIYQSERNNLGPRVGIAWDPVGNGKMALRAGYGLSYDANLGAVTSQSRNVFPTFVPLNLDPNFQPPAGTVVNSPVFFDFRPTQAPMIRPGTLNTFNFTGAAFATALGTLFVQAPPAPGINFSSNGLAFTLPEKDLKTGYAQHFVFSAERQFGDNFVAVVNYVGGRGLHLVRFATPNAGLLSTPVLFFPFASRDPRRPNQNLWIFDLPPTIPAPRSSRPEQALGAYTVFQDSAGSSYHSLQVSVEQRLRRGLQFRGSWTWSHAIDEVSDPFDGRGFFSLAQEGTRPDLERASASFDARHRVAWFFVWNLPAPGNYAALRNWKWAAAGEFQSGQPFTVNTSFDQNRDGNLTDRLDSLKGITVRSGDAYPIRLDPGVPIAPTISPQNQCMRNGLVACPRENGRVGRNTFRADGISAIDLALWRSFSIRERTTLDLRAEAFNIFNRTHFGIPVRILESPGFGRAFDTQINPRSIRLALRLAF
ncbi:MAG TPA: TonB-dependent receptor [Acidobacteriota bacterium]|nr:TonB-dependent receptor [Acidobacteriota bacterium]